MAASATLGSAIFDASCLEKGLPPKKLLTEAFDGPMGQFADPLEEQIERENEGFLLPLLHQKREREREGDIYRESTIVCACVWES